MITPQLRVMNFEQGRNCCLKRHYKDQSIHNQGSTKCYHKNGCHLVVKNKEVSGRVFSFLKQTTGGQGWVQWEA